MHRSIVSCCAVVLAACGDGAPPRVPTLQDVALTTPEDTPLTVTVPLTAADLTVVTLSVVTPPSHGTVTGTGPTWTYTPAANYFGADSMVVTAQDSLGAATASVSITVTSVNDTPTAGADSFAAGFATALVLPSAMLLANDSDVDGMPLAVTGVTAGTHGTVVLEDGNIVFTPEVGYEGPASFTYTVSDGVASAVGEVSVTVGADAPPVAVDDTAATDEDAALMISDATLLGNDSDPEHQTITISAVGTAGHGTVSHTGTTVTYTPDANYHGPDTFAYTVTDGYLTDVATVAITVNSINDVPVAADDPETTDEDTLLSLPASALVANDSDVDADTLTITAVTATEGTHGAVVLEGTTVLYAPEANYNGPASFTYTVSDGQGGTATATVSVTVDAINDAPVAIDDVLGTSEDMPLTVSAFALTSNDTDVEDDGLTLTAVSATGTTHGTVVLADGSVTYTPDVNYAGAADFDYTISDGNGGSATGHVAVTVTAVNDAPVVTASPGTLAYSENDPAVAIDPGVTVSDVDGATLVGAMVRITTGCGSAEDVLALASPPGGITVVGYTAATCTLILSGSASLASYQAALRLVTYVNTSDAPATTARTVQFAVDDGAAANNLASATRGIAITAADDAPVAVDDSASVLEDAPPTAIDVLGNDTDVDAGPRSIAQVTQPAHGVVVITGGGTGLTYAPSANYCNPPAPPFAAAATRAALGAIQPMVSLFDTFTYTLAPGGSVATVQVTVTCVDDPATAVTDTATVAEGSTANVIDVLANDTDIDGGVNTIASITQPGHGTAAIAGTLVTYTPAAGYCNQAPNTPPDTFSYTVTPGGSSALVSLTVTCACGLNKPTDFVVGSN